VLDGSERVIGVMVLDIGRGQIQAISSIVNPDKLAHLSSTADLANRFCTRDRVASNSRRSRSRSVSQPLEEAPDPFVAVLVPVVRVAADKDVLDTQAVRAAREREPSRVAA
jgi:hypothetical protein